ncbi:MAG: hypothetical protein FJ279_04465 [Planctomycetes bacterium]|nr:hypothetical protein [Planctomycetota bacterium]
MQGVGVETLADRQTRRLAKVQPLAALGEIQEPQFLLQVGRLLGQPPGIGPPPLAQEFQAHPGLLVQLPADAGISPDQFCHLLLGHRLAGGKDVLNLVNTIV